MQISLENQTVVVTGGARRLGRAIAVECARAGASVAISYKESREEAEQVVEEMSAQGPHRAQRFEAVQCDVERADAIVRLKEEVLASMGTPTALVNNAAVFSRLPFRDADLLDWEEDFDRHIKTNLKGPYLLCKTFGDLFLEQGQGAILNLADIYGSRPLKNYVAYCISKAGVLMLTQTLAKALAPNVRVNAICPGTILLPSQNQGEEEENCADDEEAFKQRIPLQRLGTPEEIAQAAVFLIGGPQYISGALLPVDGAQILR